MLQDTDLNETLRDCHFKDDKPLQTVARIRNILQKYGIETEEIWNNSGVPYCHSLRINIRNINFGTNGKGLTKEFALASGYGELMERLQLGHISKGQKDGNDSIKNGKEETVKASDLLEHNRKWYEIYAKQVKLFTGSSITPEEILAQFTDSDGNVSATPYYSVTTNSKVHLPTRLRRIISGTNGYAAGNTMAEAIVQACSEIVERSYKMQILADGKPIPTIPDSVLQQYPTAYKIISDIRSHGFQVFVKDCSLGTKFPVICICYIDQNSGKYHTHFGAYPIFEIALTRALTETFQGRSIDSFAEHGDFFYNQSGQLSTETLIEDLVRGETKRTPEFFLDNSTIQWNSQCGFSSNNNQDLCKECMAFFTEQGYDVLLRDSSCLGFPTCQVVIPGLSDVLTGRLSPEHNDLRFVDHVEKVMRNPEQASIEDMMATVMYINENKKIVHACNLTLMAKIAAYPTSERAKIIVSATMAYIYYQLGQYLPAIQYINNMLPVCDAQEEEYLLCLKRYLSMKHHNYEDSKITSVLSLFHTPSTISAMNNDPLLRFTLHCDGIHCEQSCPLYHCCCQKQAQKLADFIIAKSQEMDFKKSMKTFQHILCP